MDGPFFTKDCLASHPGAASFHVGDYSYGTPNIAYWQSGAALHIGRFCSIGLNVVVYLGGNHRTDFISTYPFSHLGSLLGADHAAIPGHPGTKGDVVIGNDVWIANSAIILSGVSIGHGAAIGCGAVVASDVPPYAIAAGNPARVVKRRFADDIVERLLAIAWWDWDIASVNAAAPLIMSRDLEGFFRFAEERTARLAGESENQP